MISHSPSHSSVGVFSFRAGRGKRFRPRQLAPIVVCDRIVDRQHAVNRRLIGAGKFAGHHIGEMAVAPENQRRAQFLRHMDDFAQFDDTIAARQGVGRHRRRSQPLRPGKILLRQADHDLDRGAFGAAIGIAHGDTAQQHANCIIDVALLDAEEFQPVLIDGNALARTRMSVGIVDIDDERNGFEDFLDFLRLGAAGRGIRPVDFGQKRGQNRRPRRHFDDLDHGAGRQHKARKLLAQCERDGMAGARTRALGREIDLQLAQIGKFTENNIREPDR